MMKNTQKKGWAGILLSVLMGVLVSTAVITTASGCLVCRDCGPNRHFRR